MNKNDMRSVVYLIISLIALYYLLDAFKGKNKIGSAVDTFIGNFGGTADPNATDPTAAPAAKAAQKSTAAAPATQPAAAAAPKKAPATNPAPAKQPATQPQTKSSSGGFSLNDIAPHFNVPSWLGNVAAATAGTVHAVGGILGEIGAIGADIPPIVP